MRLFLLIGFFTTVFINNTYAQSTNLNTEIKNNTLIVNTGVNFGTVNDSLSKLIVDTLNKKFSNMSHCPKDDKIKDTRPKERQYRCGEIPVGTILDNHWKEVLDFKVPSQTVNSDGAKITTQAFDVQVLMGRKQFVGDITINNLDVKAKDELETKNAFIRDLYLQYSPVIVREGNAQDRAMNIRFCSSLPGNQWTVPEFNFKGRYLKHIWWFIWIDTDFTITLDLGELKYNYIETCGMVQVRVDSKTQRPEIKVLSLNNPRLDKASHKGVKANLRIHNWLIRLIANLFVGQDKINGMLTRAIKNKIDATVTEKDMDTGAWFSKVQNEFYDKKDIKKSAIDALEKAVNEELAFVDYVDPNKYRQVLVDYCNRLDSSTIKLPKNIINECKNTVLKSKIVIEPFIRLAEENELECYSHMSHVFETHKKTKDNEWVKKWWYDQCSVSGRVTFELPPRVAPLVACLASVQGAINGSSVNESKEKVLKLCSSTALQLVDPNKVGPLLASIEEVLKSLNTKDFPAKGVDFIPGLWPMKDIPQLRTSSIKRSLSFKENKTGKVPKNEFVNLGPNAPLAKGSYSAQFFTSPPVEEQKKATKMGTVEVWDNTNSRVLAQEEVWSDLSAKKPTTIQFDVEQNSTRIQFRFKWDADVDTRIHRIHLDKTAQP